MKKRLLSILLIGCMLLTLLPAAVFAEDASAAVTEVKTAQELTDALNSAATEIKLMDNIDISTTLKITRTVTLDLNGFVLKMTGSGGVFLIIEDNARKYFGNLTLTDSNPTAVHKFKPNGDGPWVLDETGGTKTVKGGVITGGTGTKSFSFAYGGGVDIRGGAFTMTGGNIVGCTASGGGGVYVFEPDSKASSTFTLAGGSIVGCTANTGGGVYVNSSGASTTKTAIFTFMSGSIQDCKARGEGDALELLGTMYADGGTVYGAVDIAGGTVNLTSSSFTGTVFNGDVRNSYNSTISGGTFNGKVTNYGTITGGTFENEIKGTPALATGSGTEPDPYRISTAEGLKWFRDVVNGMNGQTQNAGACAVLTADIVLNDGTFDEKGSYTPVKSGEAAEKWTPIGYEGPLTGNPSLYYTGTFDGAGHTIRGLYVSVADPSIDDAEVYLGLFSSVKDATIRNVTVTGYISGFAGNMGGIAGYITNSTIENCANHCTVKSTTDNNASYTGGIAGVAVYGSTLRDCYNTGTITEERAFGYHCTGGIVGYTSSSRVSNCYNVGMVAGSGNNGGIIGLNYPDYRSTVSNCYYLRSTSEDANPEAKSAEEFADGTVLAKLKEGERGGNVDPWAEECEYLAIAGRTLPVFNGQGDTHSHTQVDVNKWESNDTYHWQVCACGAKFNQAEHAGGKATCTEQVACTVCGTKYGNVLGHLFSEWQCDNDKHWKECSRCATKSEEALHVWDSGTITIEPTCTNEGQTRYTCRVCHTTKVETIPVSGHSPAAGWTSDASHHWHECTNDYCDVNDNSQKVGYAEHTGGTATCTERAECDACGAVYGDLNAANHGDLQYVPAKPATITEEGNIEYWYCAACGKYYKDAGLTEEIKAEDSVLARIPYFGYSTRTIRASAGTGGSITPSGSVSVRTGHDQTFTITPDKGYAIADVKVDGRSVGAVRSYTFQNVSSEHTIEVSFRLANTFADVPAGSYYEEAVAWAVANGITAGTDAAHFSPDSACTRAQAVTFLWRAAGSPAPKTGVMPFADVPANSYYYDAVLWAVETGITTGTSAAAFSPDEICTRAQIASFLYRLIQSEGGGFTGAWMFLLPFSDTPAWAYEAIAWCYQKNITSGTTATTFSPDAPCTRAQIVTFLWRCKQ